MREFIYQNIIPFFIANAVALFGLLLALGKLLFDIRKWKDEAGHQRNKDIASLRALEISSQAQEEEMLNKLSDKVWKRTNELAANMEATIKKQAATIEKKDKSLEKKDSYITALEADKEEKKGRINVLEKKVKELETQLALFGRLLKRYIGTDKLEELKKT